MIIIAAFAMGTAKAAARHAVDTDAFLMRMRCVRVRCEFVRCVLPVQYKHHPAK